MEKIQGGFFSSGIFRCGFCEFKNVLKPVIFKGVFLWAAILTISVSLGGVLQAAGTHAGGGGGGGRGGGSIGGGGARSFGGSFGRGGSTNFRFGGGRFNSRPVFAVGNGNLGDGVAAMARRGHNRFHHKGFFGAGPFGYSYPYYSSYYYGDPYYGYPNDYSPRSSLNYQQYILLPLTFPDATTSSYSGGAVLSDTGLSDIQAALAQQGYYQGPVDGIMGPMTRQAINAYQRDNDLSVTGRVTPGLLGRLGLR